MSRACEQKRGRTPKWLQSLAEKLIRPGYPLPVQALEGTGSRASVRSYELFAFGYCCVVAVRPEDPGRGSSEEFVLI